MNGKSQEDSESKSRFANEVNRAQVPSVYLKGWSTNAMTLRASAH